MSLGDSQEAVQSTVEEEGGKPVNLAQTVFSVVLNDSLAHLAFLGIHIQKSVDNGMKR